MAKIEDDRKFFLFCEPLLEQKHGFAINDEYTSLVRMAMTEAKIGKSNFKEPGVPEPIFKVGNKHRGTHKTCDGIISDQYDYQLKNGLITNCLCVYYLMWYRLAICKQDWDKIKDLQRFYGRSQAQLQNMFDNKKLY